MTTRARVLVALAALPALLLAGCATSVAGDPRPAVTFSSSPTTSSSESTTTSAETTTSSQDTTSSSSEIPPIPPSSETTESDTSTTESDDTTTSSSDSGDDTIGGISVQGVLDDLGDDNVAMVNSSADADDLASAVADARSSGLELSVVSIGDKTNDSDAGDLADAVFSKVKGTVLVLTPSTITSRSDQLTSAQLKAANKAASSGKDDLDAVQKYTASALGADAPSSSKTTTSKKTTAAPTKDVVNGVDVAAIASATSKDGVYVQSGVSGVDRADLVKLVKSSASKDLDLTIFILADDVTGHLYDVADGVRKYSKGTVIGMSPTVYAISSGSFSNSELQDAIDSASDATTYLEVAQDMVKSLLSS